MFAFVEYIIVAELTKTIIYNFTTTSIKKQSFYTLAAHEFMRFFVLSAQKAPGFIRELINFALKNAMFLD